MKPMKNMKNKEGRGGTAFPIETLFTRLQSSDERKQVLRLRPAWRDFAQDDGMKEEAEP